MSEEIKKQTLKNTYNVGYSQNEYMHRHIVNRNTEKLIENDVANMQNSVKAGDGRVVKDFNADVTYDTGDLVWFRDAYNRTWLLRKIINYTGLSDNPNDSVTTYDETPDFEQHGWKNENNNASVNDSGIPDKIRILVNTGFNEHEISSFHKNGTIRNAEDLEEKFLLADFSNLKKDRDYVFYPYISKRIESDESILDGYARIWDCGLIEFDITYRFGYQYTDDYGQDVLSCNDIKLSYMDNQKYFNQVDDASIFYIQNSGSNSFSTIGNYVQGNRNDYVNTYFASIRFPVVKILDGGIYKQIQIDANYMIFGSNVMSQDRGLKSVNQSANEITYCDRTKSGFRAMLITFPDNQHYQETGYNAKNGGLVSNTFHCQVIGKWRVNN